MKTPVLIATPLRSWKSAEESLSKHLRRLVADLGALESQWSFDFTVYAGGNVARGRNKIIAYALRASYRYVLFIDDDIEPTVEDVLRLLGHRKHVVGGLYVTREATGRLVLNPFKEAVVDDSTGLLPVGEIGCGFKCYHRSVFEHLIQKEPDLCYTSDEDGNPEWGFFSMGVMQVDGKRRWLSEDYWFDQLCRKHGVTVFADIGVKVRHRDIYTGVSYPIDDKWPELPKPYIMPSPPESVTKYPPARLAGRMVIALQYWKGDREAAMRLARFIADLEPRYRNDVAMFFVPRFDCETDYDTLRHVSEKMDIMMVVTPTHSAGYPQSPNVMALDVMRQAKTWEGIKFVQLMEADCIPVSRSWIDELHAEWDGAAMSNALVLGSWTEKCGSLGHINGNLMFDPKITDILKISSPPETIAWDIYHATAFSARWMRTGLIANRYKQILVTEEQIKTPECGTHPPVLIHGVKDDSVLNYALKLLG